MQVLPLWNEGAERPGHPRKKASGSEAIQVPFLQLWCYCTKVCCTSRKETALKGCVIKFCVIVQDCKPGLIGEDDIEKGGRCIKGNNRPSWKVSQLSYPTSTLRLPSVPATWEFHSSTHDDLRDADMGHPPAECRAMGLLTTFLNAHEAKM